MTTKTKKKVGTPFALGGLATLKKYGKKHFSDLAKRRWAKVRRAKKKEKK